MPRSRRKRMLFPTMGLLFLGLGARGALGGEVDRLVADLMAQVKCTCPCGMTLAVCERDDPSCTTRPEIVRRIRQLAGEGRREDQILAMLTGPTSPSQKAITRAREAGKYAFLYFYEKGSDACDEMERVIEEAERGWSDRADIVRIDINDPDEQAVVREYRIYQAPVTLVMAPNGAVTRGFPGVVTLERLEKAFVSPKMAEIAEALQKRKVIFVCVQNEHTQYAEEVSRSVEDVSEVLGKSVRVIKVDPSDEREMDLLKQIKVEPNTDMATTLVISQAGMVGDTFVGKIENRDLFIAFQKVLRIRSGCGGSGSGPGGQTCE